MDAAVGHQRNLVVNALSDRQPVQRVTKYGSDVLVVRPVRGIQKVHRLTQSYFLTIKHSFLQLECTWSGVSPKLTFHCRRIVHLAVSASHLSADNVTPLKLPLAWRDLYPHLTRGSLVAPKSTTQTASHSVQLFLQGARL